MYSDLMGNHKNCGIKSPQDNIRHTDPPGISGWLCEGRFSYDAFVLNNKKDAIVYSGPFSCTDKVLNLRVGEAVVVNGINYTGTITAAATISGKVTTSVSGGAVTITGAAATAANTPETITLTDSGSGTTTTISITVVS